MSVETAPARAEPTLDDAEIVHIGCEWCDAPLLCGEAKLDTEQVPGLEPWMVVCAPCQLEYEVDPLCRRCGRHI